MSRLDADALLRRALERSAAAAGLALGIERSESTRWASATFVGARHELTATLADHTGADAWLAALPEAELPLRGHLLADLQVVGRSCTDGVVALVIEALTVEDA